jgi:hypothetical protein
VSAAVVGEDPIDPSLATHIAQLPANDLQHVGVNTDQTLIDDALDEAVFVDQREAEKREQAHFTLVRFYEVLDIDRENWLELGFIRPGVLV